MSMDLLNRVIVAVDVPYLEEAKNVIDETRGIFQYAKIGMQAFFGFGDYIIPYAKDSGFKIFLDLKLCDIPNTVSFAIRSLARYRFDLLTVHISGGYEMLRDSVNTLSDVLPDAGILGVTILTSLNDKDLKSVGFDKGVRDVIKDMVNLAISTKLYGIICSASDLEYITPIAKGNLKIITPGIRLTDNPVLDQKRVETPIRAFESGADFIVMGRPIIEGDIKSNIKRLKGHLLGMESR